MSENCPMCGYLSVIDLHIFTSEALPPDAQFIAHVRKSIDAPALAELSTAAGTIALLGSVSTEQGVRNEVRLTFRAAMTASWSRVNFGGVVSVVTDVARIDVEHPQHLGFQLQIGFKIPITRTPT